MIDDIALNHVIIVLNCLVEQKRLIIIEFNLISDSKRFFFYYTLVQNIKNKNMF